MRHEKLDIRLESSHLPARLLKERSRSVNGLVCLLLVFTLSIASCGTRNNHLSEDKMVVIKKLDEIKKGDLFSAGANYWEGYTGFKDKIEKKVYSSNTFSLINELKMQIKGTADLSKIKETLIRNEESAEVLEEKFRADTDESEIRWMYFDRIRRIVRVKN